MEMMMADTLARALPGFTQETLRVRTDLQNCKKPRVSFRLGDLTVDACEGRDTLWIRFGRPNAGGIALRTVFGAGPYTTEKLETSAQGFTADLASEAGAWRLEFSALGGELARVRVTLKPSLDLLIPFWPRDLYVLDNDNDPSGAKGNVEAGQRGFNTGLCFFHIDDPGFGTVLYLQNLTSLNPYFKATGTKPDGVVGGEWPELGYQPPAAPNGNSPPTSPLKAGTEYVVSDAFLGFRPEIASDEIGGARRFVDMIADIYPFLERPELRFHDWPERAHKTLHDLKTSAAAHLEHYGHLYLHPYTDAEYPDSMVQMSVASSLDEYEMLTGEKVPFKDRLMAGMGRFYDKKLGTIRRYLPNVGDDKNADAVDSWYLYHPLMNLARLAIRGDKKARKLFTESLDYAIKAAHHFKYVWPVQYDVRNFKVITKTRGDGYGQTDVAGLYAYVMLQAHQLTGDSMYVEEAKAAMKACEDMRFELVYQTNLSAWGVAACIKLWKQEEDDGYLSQAEVFLASFVHNCAIWDSKIGHARHYSNFFGATCLHDAPYMAAYECFESFSAFDEVLHLAGEDLPPKMKLLLAEFRRFAFDRSWAYYPDALPADAVAQDDIRNGHIDRDLSFPMEDLYVDGQAAGQVGQEIYGCGGAFIIAARGFFERDIPFRIFADYPYSVVCNDGNLHLILKGPSDYSARIRLMPKRGRSLPDIAAESVGAQTSRFRMRKADDDDREFDAPADGVVALSWRD
jgi:hypothetical protein